MQVNILAILLLTIISVHSSGPPVLNVIANFTYITYPYQFYLDNVIYFNPFAYNLTSQQLGTMKYPSVCSIPATFTLSMIPWCYESLVSTSEHTLDFEVLSDNLAKVNQSKYIDTFPTLSSIEFAYSRNYVIFFVTVSTQLRKYELRVIPFNPASMTTFCNQTFNPEIDISSAYTDGEIFLYGISNKESNNFAFYNCSTGETTTTPGQAESYPVNIYGFNSSKAFINYYEENENGVYYPKIEIASLNSSNALNFGPLINVSTFNQYNDTHYYTTSSSSGSFEFEVFFIGSDYEPQKVFSFNTGVLTNLTAEPLSGTSMIYIFNNLISIYYDIEANAIVDVSTINTPIFLSNGSTVNLTRYGYFIQSPGEPFYFVTAPFSNAEYNVYQDPSDFNQYYTLFINSTTYNYYNICQLTHINSTNSQITITELKSCPLTLKGGNPIVIKDVKFAEDGSVYVAYRDAFGSLYIVNEVSSFGPYAATSLFEYVQISMNLTNQTVNFAGTQSGIIVFGRFNLTTGIVMQLQKENQAFQTCTIGKLSSRYVMVAGSTGSMMHYEVWDWNNLVSINTTFSTDTIFLVSVNSIVTLGFSEDNPGIYAGLVLWTDRLIYLINNTGQVYEFDAGLYNQIYDVNPVGGNKLSVSVLEYDLYYQALLEVNTWDFKNLENKLNEVEY